VLFRLPLLRFLRRAVQLLLQCLEVLLAHLVRAPGGRLLGFAPRVSGGAFLTLLVRLALAVGLLGLASRFGGRLLVPLVAALGIFLLFQEFPDLVTVVRGVLQVGVYLERLLVSLDRIFEPPRPRQRVAEVVEAVGVRDRLSFPGSRLAAKCLHAFAVIAGAILRHGLPRGILEQRRGLRGVARLEPL